MTGAGHMKHSPQRVRLLTGSLFGSCLVVHVSAWIISGDFWVGVLTAGVITLLVGFLSILLTIVRSEPPRRRYDAIGDDIATMIERAGDESHPRRARKSDR